MILEPNHQRKRGTVQQRRDTVLERTRAISDVSGFAREHFRAHFLNVPATQNERDERPRMIVLTPRPIGAADYMKVDANPRRLNQHQPRQIHVARVVYIMNLFPRRKEAHLDTPQPIPLVPRILHFRFCVSRQLIRVESRITPTLDDLRDLNEHRAADECPERQ
jgi:hypothetical protein